MLPERETPAMREVARRIALMVAPIFVVAVTVAGYARRRR